VQATPFAPKPFTSTGRSTAAVPTVTVARRCRPAPEAGSGTSEGSVRWGSPPPKKEAAVSCHHVPSGRQSAISTWWTPGLVGIRSVPYPAAREGGGWGGN
jgi:hypothetical protein